jgi:hypothetical protein
LKKKQVEAINKNIEETLIEMRQAELSNNDFTIYYRTILTPKITCNLGLTSMSKRNSDTMTTKMLKTCLRKRNFSRTAPNGVSLGSRKMGGLESIDIYTQQGSGNLIQFSKASRYNNQKGKLLKIAYMWWRYTLGIEKCPLQIQEEGINISYSDYI